MQRLGFLGIVLVLAITGIAVGYPPATITDVTPNSVKVGGLACGTRYEIRIRERNTSNTGWTNLSIYTPTTAACSAPEPPPQPLSVDLTQPANGSTVQAGTVGLQATASNAAFVEFWTDGTKLSEDPTAPYTANWNATAGSHQIAAVANNGEGQRVGDQHSVTVQRSEPPPSSSVTWAADHEGPSMTDWTSFIRPDGCNLGAVSASSQGIPAHDGTAVAFFEQTAACTSVGDIHTKTYKSWRTSHPHSSTWRDDANRLYELLPGGNPSGIYRAWYYIPTSYEVVVGDWTNIFQFKHGYLSNGVWNHEPQWWVNLTEARTWGLGDTQPALVLNCYDCGGIASTARLAPKGRWFQIEADLYNADRIVWKLDGQPWYTSTQSMARGIGLDNPTSTEWVFGVGHYGGLGKLWVDDASFTPR